MMRLINSLLVILMLAFSAPVTVSAACAADPDTKAIQNNSSSDQVLEGVQRTGTKKCNDQPVKRILRGVINIISLLAGVIFVIAVMVSGLRFVTSGGDPQKAAAARSALTVAIIGIVIAALAQVLVHLVLNTANDAIQ